MDTSPFPLQYRKWQMAQWVSRFLQRPWLFLFLVPFLDRQTARGEKSPLFFWIGVGIVTYIVVLSVLGYVAPGGE